MPDLDLDLDDIERSLDRQRSDGGCVPTVEWDEIDALMAEVHRLRASLVKSEDAVEGLLDEVDKVRGNLASCEEALAMAEAAFAVPAEYIANQRSLGWPDIHPEDYCHRCGRPNPLWHAESQAWYDATGMTEPGDGGGVMCPNCFTEAYKAAHPGERVLFWVTTKTYENGVWMSDHDAVTNETLSALRDKDAEILRLDTIIGNWNAERCDKPKGHVFASDVGFDEVRDESDRLLAENQRLRQVEGTARSLVQAVGPNPPPHLYHPVVALRALLGDGRDEALAPFGGDQ